MVKRSKKHVRIPQTREEIETVVSFLSQSITEHNRIVAEMEGRIQEIRDEYMKELARISVEIKSDMAVAQLWAEQNKAVFGELKSLALTHGVIGFRTGNWQVKTLRKMSFEAVLENMQIDLDAWEKFIRNRPEIDKEALIANRDKLSKTALDEIGVKIVQGETFFVEPKTEEVPL